MTAESSRTAALRERVRALMSRAKRDPAELVLTRSVADPRQFPPEECARTADFLVRAFTGAGLRGMRRVTTREGTDSVVGHAPGPEGAPTVLVSAAPWGARVEVEPGGVGRPFRARTDGPVYRALAATFREAPGTDMVRSGQGGPIPLCDGPAERFPDAEVALTGAEEPGCPTHAPDESVDPSEIERMAAAEALLLSTYATPLRT